MEHYDDFNENIKTVICKNIKKYRTLKKVNLMKLAEEINVSVDHLKRIEAPKDRNNMSIIMLYKAIVVYHQDANFFFTEPEENAKKL